MNNIRSLFLKLLAMLIVMLLALTQQMLGQCPSGSRETDSLALVDFYYALDGSNWNWGHDTWLSSKPLHTWEGVYSINNAEGRITNLWLQENKMTGKIPESFGNLCFLQKAHLSNNNIQHLPESIGNLFRLQILELTNNQISSLPEEIGKLSNLQTLRIGNNQLINLPERIGELVSLITFTAEGNKIQQLPNSIGDLLNLKDLVLDNNQLEALPNTIKGLTKLTSFFVRSNHLKKLPNEMGNLSSLQKLYVNNNQISNIPETIGDMYGLIELGASHNNISTIPKTIGNLRRLHWIQLASNQITEIPDEFWELTQLFRLYLQSNKLTSFTIRRGVNLIKLDALHIDDNQISSIHIDTLQIPNIVYLTMFGNQVDTLPKGISGLKSLNYLRVDNNKFTFQDVFPTIRTYTYFEYSPQAKVGRPDTLVIPASLEVAVDEAMDEYTGDSLTDNTYIWYKNGVAVQPAIDGKLGRLFKATEPGQYHYEITNRDVPNLTLVSEPITVLSDLVAYYPFNSNANDESGNGHHGTVSGATYAGNESCQGVLGYTFDASNGKDAITAADHADFTFSNKISFAAWIQPQEINRDGGGCFGSSILSKGSWGANSSFGLGYAFRNGDECNSGLSEKAFIGANFVSSTGEQVVLRSPHIIELNMNYHIAFTYDGDLGKAWLYINGKEVAQMAVSNLAIGRNTSSLVIGGGASSDAYIQKGNIDEVRIYNTALSALKVEELYKQSYSNIPIEKPSIRIASANLIAIGKLGEGERWQWYKNDSPISMANGGSYSRADADLGVFKLAIERTDGSGCKAFSDSETLICKPGTSRETDSLALVAIYNKMGGVNWVSKNNWLSNEPINKWQWVYCAQMGGELRVRAISTHSTGNGQGITNNVVGDIPMEIGDLGCLSGLSFQNNKVTGMPKEIGSLPLLSTIDLWGNQVRSIPDEIANLRALTWFIMHKNQIDTIPESFYNTPNVGSFYFAQNKIRGISPSVGKLKYIGRFDIGSNPFEAKHLPKEIGNLTYVEWMSLWGLWLDDLPEEMGRLTRMQRLLMAGNNFKDLPKGLQNFGAMWQLNVYYNYLTFEDLMPYATDGVFRGLGSEESEFDSLNYVPLPIPDLYDSSTVVDAGNQRRIASFTYAPQQNIDTPDTLSVNQYLEVHIDSMLDAVPDDAMADNTYTWFYKNENGDDEQIGKPQMGLAGRSLLAEKPGRYYYTAENPLLPALTLRSQYKVVLDQCATPANRADSLALAAVYEATNGEGWANSGNWLSNAPLDQWHGVTLNAAGWVAQLQLAQNGLSGTLPAAMANMPCLHTAILSGNALEGVAGTYSRLNEFDLSENRLTFSDVLPNIDVASYIYAPQAPVGKHFVQDGACEGGQATLTIDFDDLIPGNSYQWYRKSSPAGEAKPIVGAEGLSYTATQSGIYYYMVSNPLAPKLTLQSREKAVFIKRQ